VQPDGFLSRRRLLDTGAFTSAGLQYAMDWDLYIQLMKDGGDAVHLPRVLTTLLAYWAAWVKSSRMRWMVRVRSRG
jgi:hypothetical protein